ncbi:MAG: GNAT family N-acetyltransferase [Thermoplasmata archaeon]|jgi:GNAT superfamily N-acetyltransferase|nr:GNAT family N-acetyltransferase [Thermoplasmata archaeon]
MGILTYRHPAEEDLPFMAEVSDRSCAKIPFYRPITLDELRVETFGSDDFDPRGAMIVLDDGQPVAVGEAIVEKARVAYGLNEGWMRLYVVPEERGRGIEERLMALMEEYLRERGIERAIARYYTSDDWFKDVTVRASMVPVRLFSHLEFRKGQPVPPVELPGDVKVERYDFKSATEEQLRTFLDLDGETFAENWGFAPMPYSKLTEWQKASEDIHCITIARSGQRGVGLTFLEDSVPYNKRNGTRDGWVTILGVVKDRRHQGLGRALLIDGMRWLLDRGLDTIYIAVDTENERALRLYTGVGFQLKHQTVVVHKQLR